MCGDGLGSRLAVGAGGVEEAEADDLLKGAMGLRLKIRSRAQEKAFGGQTAYLELDLTFSFKPSRDALGTALLSERPQTCW